jgi:hypothetical protein
MATHRGIPRKGGREETDLFLLSYERISIVKKDIPPSETEKH